MTKRQQIFDILDKHGYISDTQTVKIFGDEGGIWKIGDYVRIWRKLQSDRDFFADKKIIEKSKGYRCHTVRVEGQEDNQWYKVGKEFYDSIVL